jgi:hypothetical protein
MVRSKDWVCNWNSAANTKLDFWTCHLVAFLVFVDENAVVLTAWDVCFGGSCRWFRRGNRAFEVKLLQLNNSEKGWS